MSVPTFVDLQGYKVGDKFIVKEAAILRSGTVLSHYIFTNPMPWRSLTRFDKLRVSWLMTNHHGLRWTDGFTPYSRAKNLITTAVTGDEDAASRLVYVKGHEKRAWVANLLDNDDVNDNIFIETLDADYEDVASLDKLEAVNTLRCNHHKKHCALQNVLKMYNWWSQRQRELRNF